MSNITKFNEVQPTARVRFIQTVKTSALLAPFLAVPAFAQTGGDLSTLGATATSGTDTVQAVVLTLAGVTIAISLIVWGARHMKPKG